MFPKIHMTSEEHSARYHLYHTKKKCRDPFNQLPTYHHGDIKKKVIKNKT